MRYLTKEELNAWNETWIDDLLKGQDVTIQDVTFRKYLYSIKFYYKNASGLLFPDNGYNGQTEDKRDYYPLVRLSCRYSQDMRYNPAVEPNLNVIASAIRKSWEDFKG